MKLTFNAKIIFDTEVYTDDSPIQLSWRDIASILRENIHSTELIYNIYSTNAEPTIIFTQKKR